MAEGSSGAAGGPPEEPEMIEDLGRIRDHEEWLRFVGETDSGVYVKHFFLVTERDGPDSPDGRFLSDEGIVEQGFAKLSERFGWDELARVGSPILFPSQDMEFLTPGWDMLVPEGYHDLFDRPEWFEFLVQVSGRHLAFYAVQYAHRREGKSVYVDFDYNNLFARKGEDYFGYTNDPAAPALWEAINRGEIP